MEGAGGSLLPAWSSPQCPPADGRPEWPCYGRGGGVPVAGTRDTSAPSLLDDLHVTCPAGAPPLNGRRGRDLPGSPGDAPPAALLSSPPCPQLLPGPWPGQAEVTGGPGGRWCRKPRLRSSHRSLHLADPNPGIQKSTQPSGWATVTEGETHVCQRRMLRKEDPALGISVPPPRRLPSLLPALRTMQFVPSTAWDRSFSSVPRVPPAWR